MKRLLNLLCLLALISCTGKTIEPAADLSSPTPLPIIPTRTPAAPSAMPTETPLPATPTPEPSCDPLAVDFCITDGQFLLERPLQPPANDRVDPSYRYASTAEGTRDPHHGVEFPNASGTPVYAAADGRVLFAGPDEQAIYAPWPGFYGNLVVIEHGDGLFTLYAHLSRIAVQRDHTVRAGEKIGEVGRTGGAIGSHLHFEVRRGDVEDYFATVNPELWMAPPRDARGTPLGVLVISVLDPDGALARAARFTLEYVTDPTQPPATVLYGAAYSPELLRGAESAVFGELPPGRYRIAVDANGQIQARWVEVQSGRLTQVVFVVE